MRVKGYRIRLENREVQCDLVGLFALAEAGKIKIDTKICQPGGIEFQRADSLNELSGKLVIADPWSAWESMESAAEEEEEDWTFPDDVEIEEDDDSEDDLEMDTQIMRALATIPSLSKPVFSERELVDLEARPDPQPSLAEPVLPDAEELAGKIIAFPAERSRRQNATAGGYALDEHPSNELLLHRLPPSPLPHLDRPIQKPPRHTSSLSLGRLGVLVGAGVVILLLGRSYVLDTASTVLPPHPAAGVQAPTDGASTPESEDDPYEMMESQLRSQMSLDLMEATSEANFEEALFIELGRVKLDVASVRVTVNEWAGRRRDVPQSAEFRIRLRFRSGELDRELAAVGLVVGKYIQRYSLDLTHFEVVMEKNGLANRFLLNPESARRFYIQRIGLMAYLEAQQ